MAQATAGMQKLYYELAQWWPLLSAPADYEEEAAFYRQAMLQAARRPLRTMLELGSGGGNNAWYLRRRFQMTLTDISGPMLDVSRALNPEVEHIQGDMRSLRLERRFDGIFVHDAVCYMTSETDLAQTIATAYAHCEPGGAALFAPDHLLENFKPGADTGGHDDGRRGLRYLEWTWDPDPADTTYTVDYAYLLRDADGSVTAVHDRHIEGLFPRATWLQLLGLAGFTAQAIPFQHSELEPGSTEVFVAVRPSA